MTERLEDLDWRYDDHGGRYGAAGRLVSWASYNYEWGDPRYQGELVEFRLADEEEDSPLRISDGCKRAYSWLLAHDHDIHRQVMKTLDEFFPKLRDQWKKWPKVIWCGTLLA